MATDFQNSRRRWPPSWISVNMHFWWHSCVIYQSFNIPTKFGEDRSNSNEKATDFRNLRWWPPPSWFLIFMQFWWNSRILCQILNIPTKFGEDWSKNKEMATDFQNSRRQRPPSWILLNMHFDATVALCVKVSTFSPNLVRIGPIKRKWQPIF